VRGVLEQHFGDRSDGAFTVVFRVPNSADPATEARLQALVDRAARAVPTGRGAALVPAGPQVLYGNVISTLNLAHAKGYADNLVRAIGRPQNADAYVTGCAGDPARPRPDLQQGPSLLIVYRFREELAHGLDIEAAVLRTMETAGRAVIVSGATVAIGLALLLFMPLPFMRSMGVGGFLIPVLSILAAATLQPALHDPAERARRPSRPRSRGSSPSSHAITRSRPRTTRTRDASSIRAGARRW
jgi:MMPL family